MRALVFACFPAVAVACGVSKQDPQTVVSLGSPDGGLGASVVSVDASPVSANTPDDATSPFPKLCGCGLCDPIVSADACSSDADCLPSEPCHGHACVAKAKGKKRTPDVMCTQSLECATVDANTCGCVKGFCTLYHAQK